MLTQATQAATQAVETVRQMISAGQFGALLIVVLCVWAAAKAAKTAVKIAVSIVAFLAVIYVIDPQFYFEIIRIASTAFATLCSRAQEMG